MRVASLRSIAGAVAFCVAVVGAGCGTSKGHSSAPPSSTDSATQLGCQIRTPPSSMQARTPRISWEIHTPIRVEELVGACGRSYMTDYSSSHPTIL
jgi:hypothetical protein